jgi:hypothetical protein
MDHQTLPFQYRVLPWLIECFGPVIADDAAERNHRFLEESLELVQSCGCTASEAHQLVDYVFGRPVGEKKQESGGVSVTHAALCLANDIDMHAAAEVELARIWTKVEQIRAKQAAKPKHSPLPNSPKPEWRCFHCDDVFDNWGHARNHFGYTPADGAPVCKTERSTDSTVYHLKRRLESYQREDTELHRQIHSMRSAHAAALQEEEEKGYARGLRDGRNDERMPINIIFDGPPGPEPGRFIEVEADDGRSISIGEWIQRPDKKWAFRIVTLQDANA